MKKLLKNRFNLFIIGFLVLFGLVALFAPFLAANKPLVITFEGVTYFPLFRYLLYPGYFTKNLDRFFNLLIFISPLAILGALFLKKHQKQFWTSLTIFTFLIYLYFQFFPVQNPAWDNPAYLRINQVVDYKIMKEQQKKMEQYLPAYHALLQKRKGKAIPDDPSILPTLWNERELRLNNERARLTAENKTEELNALNEHELFLRNSQNHINFIVMPFIRPYNWENDRGGNQLLNEVVPWYELSRVNRKDLTSALIFGTRISLLVGFVTVFIALMIGIPFGALAGFYGGKWDILLSRILEVWEGMPTLFMLLSIVAITEIKSVFWIIIVIGFFGWTGFARYVRAETLRVKPLAFVEAAYAIGYSKIRTLFSHVLPNSLTAVLVLIPFAILAAISAESGLSFLGLGEEGSCSLGVLMDEGRTNFPAESYLLWPPAIVLSLLLIAIALLNDAVRDALDPRVD